MDQPPIQAVPTNIITGFLGVGKTTTILNLLQSKPQQQRWAVLVNEFGEIGVDGSLFVGQHSEEQGVFIREVPGGCMCCAAGLPMQIALNQLLTRAKPDRLLIEPTGLGHPKEVLQVLSADYYQDVLTIQQCITLVDARNLSDPRYTQHDTFNQQIDMADHVIGNKVDLYKSEDKQALVDYVTERKGSPIPVSFCQQGKIELNILNGKSSVVTALQHHSHGHHAHTEQQTNDTMIPECGFVKVENQGEGYQSVGWRFAADKVFSKNALFNWICGLKVERAKGVFITDEGVFGYNVTLDSVTEMELDDCLESRIEIIVSHGVSVSESDLLLCVDE